MQNSTATDTARREFLKFLAASPYVAALGGVAAYLERNVLAQNTPGTSNVITDPAKALNVFDFEEPARRRVIQGHWAYMASGVDDDGTLRANREAFKHIELRPRRLHDATKVDMRVDLFGTTYNSPIYFCPTGGEKAFSGEGELAVARSAKAHGTLQVLSTATSTPVEDVIQELGRPVWQQLYAPTSWDACEKILRRVEAAGVSVIALTVDNTTGRNSETYLRTRGDDPNELPHRYATFINRVTITGSNNLTLTGVIGSSGAMQQLTKVGSGTATLSGNNPSLADTIFVNAGSLYVNGQQPNTPVTVGLGAIFGGSGMVGAITVNRGTLSPGTPSGPGTLSSGNVQFLNTGCTFSIQIAGPAVDGD